jgi:hypothetical protein
MENPVSRIEADARAAADKIRDTFEREVAAVEQKFTRHPQSQSHQPEVAMTTTPPETATSYWTGIHQNIDTFISNVRTYLPKLETIATNPVLDDGVEAMLAAFAGPMPAEVFAGLVAVLKADPADHVSLLVDLLSLVTHKGTTTGTGAPSISPAARAVPSFTPTPGMAHPNVVV